MNPGDRSFFDLQVNGYAGVDFNRDSLSAEQLAHACQQLEEDGVGGFLATIITADLERMVARIENLVRVREEVSLARQLIYGIHLEGPFINPAMGYVGTHPSTAVKPADINALKRLVEAGDGLVRLVTLAPEIDVGLQLTQWLVSQQIIVSAGHCNPSLGELQAAIDQGLSMFTHLGNGCPLLLDRHDNIIQRVLNLSDRLWVCFIADGVHIPFFALRNYIEVVGIDRAIVVSDAISAAGMGPGEYLLAGQRVVVDDDLATWSADRTHLMGAATPISRAHINLQHNLGLDKEQALRLTAYNPRVAVGLS